MSIYGAMFSGVSALAAQSYKMSAISDNIANANTVGYKKTEVPFSTMVSSQVNASSYSAGGISAKPLMQVTKQGLLQGSSSSTDLAISGNGMFVVNTKAENALDGASKTLFTRAGSFKPDADGNLVNTAGYYLQGWKLNSDGTFTNGTPARTSTESLESVNVKGLNFAGTPTSSVKFGANLPASATDSVEAAKTFSTSLEYYDPVGNARTMTLDWQPVVTTLTPSTVAGTASGSAMQIAFAGEPSFKVGDSVAFTDQAGAARSYTLDGTEDEGNIAAKLNAWMAGSGSDTTGFAYDAATNQLTVTPKGAGSVTGAQFNVSAGQVTHYGEWQLNVKDAASGNALGTFDINFATSGPRAGAPESITSTGSPVQFVDAAGNVISPANVGDSMIARLQVPLSNGATQQIDLNLGRIGNHDGMTQYAGDYTPSMIERDGAKFASLDRIEFTGDGVMNAVFDNGLTRPLYKVPLVDFVNPNGLTAVNGNAFQSSSEAGAFYLWDAGTGPVGSVNGSNLESSTVDIAEEFSNMIIAQRAYSSNAKIIQTADEMLQEITNLKR